jgi:hypothetical protein
MMGAMMLLRCRVRHDGNHENRKSECKSFHNGPRLFVFDTERARPTLDPLPQIILAGIF